MNKPHNTAPLPEKLSTAEAAKALGLSAQTLRAWACEGRGLLVPSKAYGRLFWDRAAVERVRSQPKNTDLRQINVKTL